MFFNHNTIDFVSALLFVINLLILRADRMFPRPLATEKHSDETAHLSVCIRRLQI